MCVFVYFFFQYVGFGHFYDFSVFPLYDALYKTHPPPYRLLSFFKHWTNKWKNIYFFLYFSFQLVVEFRLRYINFALSECLFKVSQKWEAFLKVPQWVNRAKNLLIADKARGISGKVLGKVAFVRACRLETSGKKKNKEEKGRKKVGKRVLEKE